MTIIAGQVLTPAGFVAGELSFTDTIGTVMPGPAPADTFILPGFVDLHVHGGAGADVMQGEAAIHTMAGFHARHGTTSLLATTVTAPAADLIAAAHAIAAAMRSPRPGAARIIGMHLEGPFISPDALGAQPPHAIPPDLALLETLCAIVPIRVATYAPEIDPDGTLLAAFLRHGIRAQIGHTTCTYEQARDALAGGAAGFTHLFNAMSGLHHRAPGAVGAAFAHASHAELIADLIHVTPGAALAALHAIPGLYAVTDAVAATGMPDGPYRLGRHDIHKSGDTVRLASGGLAGSVLTMAGALRNLLALGLPMDEAARRCSTLAAAYVGRGDAGELAPGCRADIVCVDAAGRSHACFVAGVAVSP